MLPVYVCLYFSLFLPFSVSLPLPLCLSLSNTHTHACTHAYIHTHIHSIMAKGKITRIIIPTERIASLQPWATVDICWATWDKLCLGKPGIPGPALGEPIAHRPF